MKKHETFTLSGIVMVVRGIGGCHRFALCKRRGAEHRVNTVTDDPVHWVSTVKSSMYERGFNIRGET